MCLRYLCIEESVYCATEVVGEHREGARYFLQSFKSNLLLMQSIGGTKVYDDNLTKSEFFKGLIL